MFILIIKAYCTMHLFCVVYRLCFVPRFNDDQMDMLRVHSVDDIDSLPAYKWGIKQPSCEGVYSFVYQ